MRRKKLIRRNRAAFTVVETVIAGTLLALLAVVCGSVVLSIYKVYQFDKNTFVFAQEAERLKEELKNYVTSDLSVTLNAPGSPAWHLPDDTSCRDCWALGEGAHDVSSRLPQELREAYGAKMTYRVSIVKYNGRELREVRIAADWKGGG